MDLKPKISFVIPAYNEEAYIHTCITSILERVKKIQHGVEIIVVNNASIDKTSLIAQSFSEVKVIDEAHKGLTWARQAGLQASSGELIAHLDADSLLPDGWVEAVLKEFESDKELVAISTGPLVYYDLSTFSNVLVRIYYYFAYGLYVLNRFILHTGSILQGGNAVIRKSSLEKINGYNRAYIFYGEDTDLARRLSTIGKVKFTLRFPMYTSGRRLSQEGMVTMGFRYALNYLWAIFWKRPFTKTVFDIISRK